MIYEVKVTYTTLDERGNNKAVSEKYLVANVDSLTTVIEEIHREFENVEIVSLRRSNITEFANQRRYQDDKIFLATLSCLVHDDNGKERQTKSMIAFFANDINMAHSFMELYTGQWRDMQMKQLKETNFIDIINHG